MNQVTELHEKAMDLAELAFVAKLNHNPTEAETLFRQTWEFETQAARLVPDNADSEPTRSILYRSAATLACDCREYREAERLIAIGLSGNPPDWVAEQLRELYEQVRGHFKRSTEEPRQTETITGQLKTIGIVDEHGHQQNIIVPADRIAEIIKPLWGEMVTVTTVQQGNERLLANIQPTVAT